jgi:hypothetical protein
MVAKDSCDGDAGQPRTAADEDTGEHYGWRPRTAATGMRGQPRTAANEDTGEHYGRWQGRLRREGGQSADRLFPDEEEGGVQGEAAGMGTEKSKTMGF